MLRLRLVVLTILLLSLSLNLGVAGARAEEAKRFDNPKFQKLWEYSDKPVEEQQVGGRGLVWGRSLAINREHYEGYRMVERQAQYFDKGRMEIDSQHPDSQVTTGLLTVEMVSGQRQLGDSLFEPVQPAQQQVAGDDNSAGGNSVAPTYASFTSLATTRAGVNRASDRTGALATEFVNRAGQVGGSPVNLPDQLFYRYYEPATGHNVPDVFVDYQNSTGRVYDGTKLVTGPLFGENPLYIFGYPITEVYWTKAMVGGVERDVAVQLFERRVLTYTPTNPAGFKVEMGNVGQHFYDWRFKTPMPAPPRLPNPSLSLPSSTGHSDEIHALEFSANGKLYSGALDDTVRRWDYRTGKQERVYKVGRAVFDLAVSPNDKTFAINDNNGFSIWDMETGQKKTNVKIYEKSYQDSFDLAFSPDSSMIAAQDQDGGVSLYSAASGEVRYKLSNPQNSPDGYFVQGIRFSPDGQYLAAIQRPTVNVWKIATGEIVATFEGSEGRDTAFSPDGRLLATDRKNDSGTGPVEEIVLWDWQNNRVVKAFSDKNTEPYTLAFSPDGTKLAADLDRNRLGVWDIETGQKLYNANGFETYTHSLAFSPDGAGLLTASARKIHSFTTATGKEVATFGGNGDTPYAIAASQGGPLVAIGTVGGDIRLINTATGQESGRLKGHTAPVNTVAFSPDGKYLASGSGFETVRDKVSDEDRTLRLWEVDSGREIFRSNIRQGIVWQVAFSPDGQTLASVSEDSRVRIWSVPDARLITTLTDKKLYDAYSVAFSHDGRYVAAGSRQNTDIFGESFYNIIIFDLTTNQTAQVLKGQQSEYVRQLAFSPDDRTLYSGGSFYTVKSWNLDDGSLGLNVYTSGENMALAPDGQTFATLSYTGNVRLWDAYNGKELSRTPVVETYGDSYLTFSPDSRTLIVAQLDGAVKIWQLK